MRDAASHPQHPSPSAPPANNLDRHPLLGTRWLDTDLSLPPGIAEVRAIEGHRAHLRFGPGRRAGEELDIELAELGRRFLRSYTTGTR